MNEILGELFKHNTWANLRLLDACAGLSDEQLDAGTAGTFGSIRKTLLHIVYNQEHYLGLLTGSGPADSSWARGPFVGFAELRQRALRSSEALADVAAQADGSQVLRGTHDGEEYAVPIAIPLIQAINHATEHRAHIATILSQQGIEPPVMDGWTYDEEAAQR